MIARVVVKPYEVNERLQQLGLTSEILQEAGYSGKLARATSTPFHPKWYSGNVLYSNALATLGLRLAPSDWLREDPAGHPLVVHHGLRIALTVASADHNTGNGDITRPPSTRPAKGPRTEEAVDENQGLLFPDLAEIFSHRHELAGYQFWWLLLHASEPSNELRMELSRGTQLNKERSIVSWSERVMLPPQPLDGAQMPIDLEPSYDGSNDGDIDFEIRKLG